MPIQRHSFWRALILSLIGLLVFVLLLVLFLVASPKALRGVVPLLPLPGVVELPTPGPTPPPPSVAVPPGPLPDGYRAFNGVYQGGTFACGFLLELEDGHRVGVSAAHATPQLPPGTPAEFRLPDGELGAALEGQLARGRPFYQDHFTMDYVLWAVADGAPPERFLKPDPRGKGESGEPVLVFSRAKSGAGGSKTWPGVVIHVTPEAVWIQLEDSFNPSGYSGCPVVSQYTGRVIGMVVAGENKHPVVMGLHPAASLVEKAQAALVLK
jgi:hypothetical protein